MADVSALLRFRKLFLLYFIEAETATELSGLIY